MSTASAFIDMRAERGGTTPRNGQEHCIATTPRTVCPVAALTTEIGRRSVRCGFRVGRRMEIKKTFLAAGIPSEIG